MNDENISPILTTLHNEVASAKRELDEKMATQHEERERLKSALRKLDAELIPLQTRFMAAARLDAERALTALGDLISELRIKSEDQRTEAALAIRKDDRCSPQAGATHEDLADLLDEAATRLEKHTKIVERQD